MPTEDEIADGIEEENAEQLVPKKDYDHYRTLAIIFTILALLLAIIIIILIILFQFRSTNNGKQVTTFVYDVDGVAWSDYEDLPIFYNGEFGTRTVAPYSSGSYEFIFSNTSEYRLTYSVVLSEVNEYDIAMCYKLECDGYYVVSESVRTDDFVCVELTVEAKSSHYFVLDWYWDGDVNDYNDTLAGINEAFYTLTITITAEAVG